MVSSKFFAICAVAAAFICSASFAAEAVRVACVGDSITYGARIVNRDADSYPAQLGKILGKTFEVRNFGVNGTTALSKGDYPYVSTPAYKSALAFNPDIVIIKLGTNDTKLFNWRFKEDFERDLSSIIKSFQGLPSHPRVFLCRPVPAYQSGGNSIRGEIVKEGVLPIIDKIAADNGLVVIDLFSALADKPQLFPDKIHPNEAGAKIIAEAVAAAITKNKK